MCRINIDAKLLAGQAGDLVELQNGCVCCSLSNELIFAVEKLITGRELDSIVIELTGIADPKAIRQRWAADLMETMPATIENVVTVIDSTTFGTRCCCLFLVVVILIIIIIIATS